MIAIKGLAVNFRGNKVFVILKEPSKVLGNILFLLSEALNSCTIYNSYICTYILFTLYVIYLIQII